MSAMSAINGSSAVTGLLSFSPGRSQPGPKAPAEATHLRVPGPDRRPEPDQEAVQKALGAKIRQLRIKRGWSQKKLASRCGLSPASVGAIERGRANTTLSTLAALMRHLGLTVSELFRDIA